MGSPAGVIDGTLERARFGKRVSGEINFRVDSDEGHRETLSVNVPVLKDVLAIRVALLNQVKKTYREPEADDESRPAAKRLSPLGQLAFDGFPLTAIDDRSF